MEMLVLHGGEALGLIFIPGVVIFAGLLVAGVALILRGLAPSSGGTSLLSAPDPDPPARSAWRLGMGGFFVLLALLFLGWCRHIGFLAS
jgi:hypothetical protein